MMGEKYWWQMPTGKGLAKTKLLAGWFLENWVASSQVVRLLRANGLEAGKIGDIKIFGMIKTEAVARRRPRYDHPNQDTFFHSASSLSHHYQDHKSWAS